MSNSERDERGYNFDFGEHYNAVERHGHGYEATIEADPEGICIRIDIGSGYEAINAGAYIHADVLVRLVERMGYEVQKRVPR